MSNADKINVEQIIENMVISFYENHVPDYQIIEKEKILAEIRETVMNNDYAEMSIYLQGLIKRMANADAVENAAIDYSNIINEMENNDPLLQSEKAAEIAEEEARYAQYEYQQTHPGMENAFITEIKQYDLEYDYMPDSAIELSERDLYGYNHADMLPLLKDRALELYEAEHTIYMLHTDGTEAMVFERGEISSHDGIFGIEADEWIASREYADMVKALDNGEASKEAALIFGSEDAYAIYQLKSGSETRDYRFEPFDSLQSRGLEVERGNYALVYSASLKDGDTPDSLYAKFNIDRPEYFTGHSLSVSDVIVMQRGGILTSHYVDSIGFKELSAFLGNEHKPEYVNEPIHSYIDLLHEHINNHADAGYLTEAEGKFLLDNIDALNTKMLAISSIYENGMPLDVETDTIDRLFREELSKLSDKSKSAPTKQPVRNSGVKKAKPSILSQLEKNKEAVAQGKETQKNAVKRNSDKEV